MDRNRRSLLKGIVTAGAVTTASGGAVLAAKERPEPPEDALGMLYDATRCIGCKTCVVACHEANQLPPDTRNAPGGIYDSPLDLNDRTKNIIKLYKEDSRISYVKRQCMHCLDPACVGACMIGALQKREHGVVTWDPARCIGCRYCQMACPFGIPKFEWYRANPRIIKCEMCKDRPGDKKFVPACCEVCPREAVIYGQRADLLEEAKRRLRDHPNRYIPKVYGETDAGGTQVLYLAAVEFEKLGLPDLGDEPVPDLARSLQHGIYKGFIAPVALYAVMGAVMFRNRKKAAGQREGEEERHE